MLRIDGVEFYADLGVDDGLRPGDTVYLYRTLRLTDAQGEVLEDLFLMGTAEVLEVGQSLSLLLVPPEVALQLSVGDRVSLEPLSAPQPELAPAPVSSGEEGPSVTPDRQAFEQAFARSAALSSPEERIEVWRAFVRAHPDSPLAGPAREEIRALSQRPQTSQTAPQQGAPRVETPPPEPLVLAVRTPDTSPPGADIPVWVTVPEAQRVDQAQLFFRRDTETLFRSVDMVRSGDASWHASIPGEAAYGEEVEFYVAVVDNAGTETQSAPPTEPASVALVEELPPDAARQNRSAARVAYDYVDFYGLQDADRFSRLEADYAYRVDAPILQSVRVGFAQWTGTTRPPARIDDPAAGQDFGYKSGFVELDVPLGVDWLGLRAQGMLGVGRDSGLTPGGQAHLRIGRVDATYMAFGAARLGPLGNRYDLSLAWASVPRVPMQAWVEVSDLPGDRGDWGVGVGWEGRVQVLPFLQLGLRGSYQLRNIEHAGPGFGGTAVFTW